MSTESRSCALRNDMVDQPPIPDRVRALALDILHRIRPVCANMPDEELLTLSTQMASVELRYFESTAVSTTARRNVAGR